MSYNRSKSLKEQLLYFEKMEDKRVQVLVLDNKSSDDSLKVLEMFRDRIPNYSYLINEKNIGCDGSIWKSLDHVLGQYVLFLGDDYYNADSIRYVVDSLDYYKPSILHVSNAVSRQRLVKQSLTKKQVAVLISNQLSEYMFMSSNFYQTSLIKEVVGKVSFEYSTTLFFSILCLSQGALLLVNERIISQDFKDITWSKNTNNVWFGSIPMIFDYFMNNGYKKSNINIMKNRNNGYFLFCSLKKIKSTLKYLKEQKRLHYAINIPSIWYLFLFSLKKLFRKI